MVDEGLGAKGEEGSVICVTPIYHNRGPSNIGIILGPAPAKISMMLPMYVM